MEIKIGDVFQRSLYKFIKVFKLIDNRAFLYALEFTDDDDPPFEFYCEWHWVTHLEDHCVRVNKVPPIEIEVEEEVPIYMPKHKYERLLKLDHVESNKCILLSKNKNCFSDPKELCRIKIKTEKKFDFNWDTGEYDLEVK